MPTPLGPNRLTLPPNQQQPHFGQGQGHDDPQVQRTRGGYASEPDGRDRPGSSRYAQYGILVSLVLGLTHAVHRRYAYAPPQTPANDVSNSIQPGPAPPQARNTMPPPPTPLGAGVSTQDRESSRFNLASRVPNQPSGSRHPQTHMFPPAGLMQAPHSRAYQQTAISGAIVSGQPQSIFPPASSNRLATPSSAPSQRFMPATPSGNSRRFLPPTVTQSASRSSRAPGVSGSSGTQRMHFGHGAQFG